MLSWCAHTLLLLPQIQHQICFFCFYFSHYVTLLFFLILFAVQGQRFIDVYINSWWKRGKRFFQIRSATARVTFLFSNHFKRFSYINRDRYSFFINQCDPLKFPQKKKKEKANKNKNKNHRNERRPWNTFHSISKFQATTIHAFCNWTPNYAHERF